MLNGTRDYRKPVWSITGIGWIVLGLLSVLLGDDAFTVVLGIAAICLGVASVGAWLRSRAGRGPEASTKAL